MMTSRRITVAMLVTAVAISLAPAPASGAPGLTVPGISWHKENGAVVVTADATVTEAQLARLRDVVGKAGRVERVEGKISTLIAGGDPIYSSTARCSVGANVRRGTTYYFITAGHCTNAGTVWYGNIALTTLVGRRAGSSFPGNDFGIVQYTNPAIPHPSAVNTYPGLLAITGTGTPVVGMAVCRSGATTRVRCGVITALNATVNYAQGSVTGLIRTNICAEPGDSGGPLYVAATGRVIGILSGGSGNCSSGGVSFYQPIAEILAFYGLTIP